MTFGLASAFAAVAGVMVLIRIGASPQMGFVWSEKAEG